MGDLTESSTPAPPRQGPFREDCWTEEATSTLVDAWGQRYMELNRGNLRQKDWQEVADTVNAKVHAANKLASRHARVWVCEVCEQAPASVTCKADAAALCSACDVDIHSANPLAHHNLSSPPHHHYRDLTNLLINLSPKFSVEQCQLPPQIFSIFANSSSTATPLLPPAARRLLRRPPESRAPPPAAACCAPSAAPPTGVACAARLLSPAVDHLLRRSLRRRPSRREREVMVGFLNQRRYFPSLAIEIIGWRRKQLDYAAPMMVEEYSKAIAIAGEVVRERKQKKKAKKKGKLHYKISKQLNHQEQWHSRI